MWPRRENKALKLNGEVCKIGNPDFVEIGEVSPDLIVHVPGGPANHAVIEIKTVKAGAKGWRKDIEKLSKFVSILKNPYERGILIIYGEGAEEDSKTLVEIPQKIEIWTHSVLASEAKRLL